MVITQCCGETMIFFTTDGIRPTSSGSKWAGIDTKKTEIRSQRSEVRGFWIAFRLLSLFLLGVHLCAIRGLWSLWKRERQPDRDHVRQRSALGVPDRLDTVGV